MFRCFTIRWLFGIAIALLVMVWIGVLYWALSHNAIPHLFRLDGSVFAHQATIVEYKSAHNLIYQPNKISEIKQVPLFKLGDLLNAWNPDDVSPKKWLESVAHPSNGHNIPRFDFSNQKQKELALKYRNEEMPFIVYNIPELENAIMNTFIPSKLYENIGNKQISVEKINSNNYLYYHAKNSNIIHKRYPDWQPPQEDILMTYKEFVNEVYIADIKSDYVNSSIPLYYFTISATEGKRSKWIREALPFFGPVENFFMVDVHGYKGINCRFGMKGITAAAHYDGRRNMVAMLRGRKRYMLQPPSECPYLELFPRSHPSARHSRVDWSNIQQVKSMPSLYNAKSTEVVLSMGEVLYIPGNWFHYIVSQDASIQCNARSGISTAASSSLQNCEI